MAVYVTQEDCEARVTPRTFRQWFTDDGSGTPSPTLIARALEEGSRQAQAILGKAGWDDGAIALLARNDEAVKGAMCDLVNAIGMKRRPEWWGDAPKPKWKVLREDAEGVLEDIVQARKRPGGEAQAGKNATYDTRVTAPEPNFVFAPSGGRNPGGGF